MGVESSLGDLPPFVASESAMNKKVPIGMLGFFVGVLAFYFLVSVASAGYQFGKQLALTHKHAPAVNASTSS